MTLVNGCNCGIMLFSANYKSTEYNNYCVYIVAVQGVTNRHTFRRTFACLLRKAGVDTMTIKDLGRWESLEMVQGYTRSISFQDSLKFYKAPLGQ